MSWHGISIIYFEQQNNDIKLFGVFMNKIILSAVLSLSFVAASASAAVNFEETSAWRKTIADNVTMTTDTAKSLEWQMVKIAKKEKNQETQVWRRIKI